jgi:hypothetical protein
VRAHRACIHAIDVDFRRRRAPHSFSTPQWNRRGTFVSDYTASIPETGAVARATVAMRGEVIELTIAWTARFAVAEGSPVAAPSA